MVRLYGGECDGFGQKVKFDGDTPEVFYAAPMAELARIKESVRDPLAKRVAIEKARTLAYRFKEVKVFEDTGMAPGMEYCYERCASEDKPSASSAPSL